jgi:hypothetical protein
MDVVKMPKSKLFMAGLLLASLLAACNREPSFEQNYAQAKENLHTPAGAQYDKQLSLFVQGLSGFSLALEDCVARNPGQGEAHGYFEFTSATKYRVVLQPENGFAACLTVELQDQAVPAPPRAPYLSPFDLDVRS